MTPCVRGSLPKMGKAWVPRSVIRKRLRRGLRRRKRVKSSKRKLKWRMSRRRAKRERERKASGKRKRNRRSQAKTKTKRTAAGAFEPHGGLFDFGIKRGDEVYMTRSEIRFERARPAVNCVSRHGCTKFLMRALTILALTILVASCAIRMFYKPHGTSKPGLKF
ncbi:hypothetical protein DFH06DRAFT_1169134 [Mycena polygramma]|nr:hypothetical protein DFH06DRAFT_1169134 [Mycena polygramma]